MRNEIETTERDIERLFGQLKSDPVAALSALTAHAKKQALRGAVDRLFSDRTELYALLSGSDPKARKNAARLLGALSQERDANALAAALDSEDMRFVIPSILLALGNAGGGAARRALASYRSPEAADETEEKHIADIREALKKALAALERDVPLPERSKLTLPRELLAVSPAGFAPVLQRELAALGFAGKPAPDGVIVTTDDLARLYRARCMAEALIPAGTNVSLDPRQIAVCVNGLFGAPYRIELRNFEGDRAAFIRAVSGALGGGDNPSRYLDELRIDCTGYGRCDVFVKPCNAPDHRFDYRKKSIPASISPVLAACLARYALSFVSAARPRTLDPFCGSGTLLFELERAVSAPMIGVDVSERALDAARENAQAAHSGARFVHKDILKFEPREAFDLVLTNLPFGNRVGSHESNEPLYRGFVRLLPRLLGKGGVALLYTMEHRLLSACLKNEPALAVTAELTTEAGGLNPRVTVVKKK